MVQRLKYLLYCVNWYEFHICLEKLKIDEKTFLNNTEMKIEMGVDTNERKNDFLRKKFLKKIEKNFLPKLLERFLINLKSQI